MLNQQTQLESAHHPAWSTCASSSCQPIIIHPKFGWSVSKHAPPTLVYFPGFHLTARVLLLPDIPAAFSQRRAYKSDCFQTRPLTYYPLHLTYCHYLAANSATKLPLQCLSSPASRGFHYTRRIRSVTTSHFRQSTPCPASSVQAHHISSRSKAKK